MYIPIVILYHFDEMWAVDLKSIGLRETYIIERNVYGHDRKQVVRAHKEKDGNKDWRTSEQNELVSDTSFRDQDNDARNGRATHGG